MTIKSLYRRILLMILISGVIFTIYFTYYTVDNYVPDEINILKNSDIGEKNYDFSYYEKKLKSGFYIKYYPENKALTADAELDISKKENNNSIVCEAKLFGLFHIKNVKINIINDEQLIPCGFQTGIYLKTEGVMVIDTGNVTGKNGMDYSPAENIVKSDDYIVAFNGEQVGSKSKLLYLVKENESKDVILTIRRDDRKLNVKIKPVECSDGEFKLGIWVRDDTQGIGTLTYVTADGKFGALGHGISDIDTGALLSSVDGYLYNAQIWGIKKGENGNPGGILGSIKYDDDNIIGVITGNTSHGVYGTAGELLIKKINEIEPMNIGLKQDVKVGEAEIISQIDNEINRYTIEILEVDKANNSKNKGMVIQVTDPKLLQKTNGIVQGMSGSPIIQNGKIIGAVTHVFVNDPTKGYGIFIENMLDVN